MRAGFNAIDRQLASLVCRRARRKSLILRLLPPLWLESLVAPRVRRLRNMLVVASLGLSLLIAAATLYLAARS